MARPVFDQRHRDVELETLRLAREREANRMTPFPPGARSFPDATAQRAERLLVVSGPACELAGKRGRSRRAASVASARIAVGQTPRRVVEQECKAPRDLVEAVNRLRRGADRLRKKVERFRIPAPSRPIHPAAAETQRQLHEPFRRPRSSVVRGRDSPRELSPDEHAASCFRSGEPRGGSASSTSG